MINDVGESLLKKNDHAIVQWCTEFERKYNKRKRLENSRMNQRPLHQMNPVSK